MTEMLQVDIRDEIAIVILNRPEAMNALSAQLRAALCESLIRLDHDPAIRAIILSGAGERAFSAGLDLKELLDNPEAMAAIVSRGSSDNLGEVFAGMATPVIGAVNGLAITGGFELALCCDLLIASTNAFFADTHAAVGALPAWGLSQRLSRLIGPYRAKQLSLTAAKIDVGKAHEWGIVAEVVEPDILMPRAIELALQIANLDASMVVRYKHMIDTGYSIPLTDALVLESEIAEASSVNFIANASK